MQKFLSANLSKISFLVFFLIVCISIIFIYNGAGQVVGIDTGAGDYYYTDIPGWEKIFSDENSLKMGTSQMVLFFVLFFGWGLFCYKFLKRIDRN